MSQIAHIFPAFVIKYTGKEIGILKDASYPFSQVLDECSDLLQTDLTAFDAHNNNFLNDEIRNQYMTYIISCAFSDILYKKKMYAGIISGFSMGIYAALYHAKSIDFNTGLLLIRDVYECVKSLLKGRIYAMASVIGFSKDELTGLAGSYPTMEIVIRNGEHSFVVAAGSDEISDALDRFREEGAIHLAVLEVACPYHTGLPARHTEKFRRITDKYLFIDAGTALSSMVDQSVLRSATEVSEEIIKNVSSHLDFHRTLLALEKAGYNTVVEAGPGDSLLKSSKFIEGNFSFKALSRGRVI